MPDEVNVDRMTGEHAQGHKRMSWVTVGLLCAATVVLAFAFVMMSLSLAIVGVVLGLVGVVLGVVGNIMEDVH